MKHLRLFEEYKNFTQSSNYDATVGKYSSTTKYEGDKTEFNVKITVIEKDIENQILNEIGTNNPALEFDDESNHNLDSKMLLKYLKGGYVGGGYGDNDPFAKAMADLIMPTNDLREIIENHAENVISKLFKTILEKNPEDYMNYPEIKNWISKEDLPDHLRRTDDIGLLNAKQK